MKGRIAVVLAGVVALHLVMVGLVATVGGGCTSKPEVLHNRPYIPAPTMQPAAVEPIDLAPTLHVPDWPAPAVIIEPELLSHTVQRGDSYWKIARQYGVSHQELAAFNQADLNQPLRIGTTLRIPPGGVKLSPDQLPPIRQDVAPATTPAARAGEGAYTVQKGDSLWVIARKFGTTTKDLAAANNMSIEKPLQVGQKLVIPGGKGPAPTVATKPTTPPTPAPKPAPTPAVEDIRAPLPGATPAPTVDDDVDALLRELESAVPATTDKPAVDKAIDDLLKPDAQAFSEHQVLPGENLQSVAELYGLRVEDLRKANPGTPADGKLAPFSIIKVPNP